MVRTSWVLGDALTLYTKEPFLGFVNDRFFFHEKALPLTNHKNRSWGRFSPQKSENRYFRKMSIFGVFRTWEHLVMFGFWLFTLKMTGKHLQKWFKILNRIRNFEISSLEINRWTHNWISDLSGLLDYLLKKFSQRPQSSWCAKCPVGLRYKTKFQILNRLIVWAGKKRHSENLHFIDENR